MNRRGVIVAGIGTEVGKTLVSAVLCEVMQARYWKPIASGSEDGPAESVSVSQLITRGAERVFSERYLFRRSLSPHVASALEGIEVSLEEFALPVCDEPLIVELAGGVMVPLNDRVTNIDLIKHLDLPVVVVSRHYLGSINHTLLTLAALRSAEISVRGIVFNGEELPDTERIIATLSDAPCIGRIPTLATVSKESVAAIAKECEWIV